MHLYCTTVEPARLPQTSGLPKRKPTQDPFQTVDSIASRPFCSVTQVMCQNS
jgi:hypothetical protein